MDDGRVVACLKYVEVGERSVDFTVQIWLLPSSSADMPQCSSMFCPRPDCSPLRLSYTKESVLVFSEYPAKRTAVRSEPSSDGVRVRALVLYLLTMVAGDR